MSKPNGEYLRECDKSDLSRLLAVRRHISYCIRVIVINF